MIGKLFLNGVFFMGDIQATKMSIDSVIDIENRRIPISLSQHTVFIEIKINLQKDYYEVIKKGYDNIEKFNFSFYSEQKLTIIHIHNCFIYEYVILRGKIPAIIQDYVFTITTIDQKLGKILNSKKS